MAIDSSNYPLSSERAASVRAAASALGHLARLLARQAARELMASRPKDTVVDSPASK